MKKIFLIKILIFSLLYIILSPAYAQPDQAKVSEKQRSVNKQTKKQPGKKAATKAFIPSEKISADSSVSFPVDI